MVVTILGIAIVMVVMAIVAIAIVIVIVIFGALHVNAAMHIAIGFMDHGLTDCFPGITKGGGQDTFAAYDLGC